MYKTGLVSQQDRKGLWCFDIVLRVRPNTGRFKKQQAAFAANLKKKNSQKRLGDNELQEFYCLRAKDENNHNLKGTVKDCFCHLMILLLFRKLCITDMLSITPDTNTVLLQVTSLVRRKITQWGCNMLALFGSVLKNKNKKN